MNKVLFSIGIIFLSSTAFAGYYATDYKFTGLQCVDLALFDSCDKHSLSHFERDGQTVYLKKGAYFESVSKFQRSRSNKSAGVCGIEIGYQDDNFFSPLGLIKRAANKLLTKDKFFNERGKKVKINYMTFNCVKQ